MEHNQDLTVAYVTVKVNGGANVLRNTKLATREKEHVDEIINYLKDIEANYPGIMFDEPVLAYTGVEYFDGREFFWSVRVQYLWHLLSARWRKSN